MIVGDISDEIVDKKVKTEQINSETTTVLADDYIDRLISDIATT